MNEGRLEHTFYITVKYHYCVFFSFFFLVILPITRIAMNRLGNLKVKVRES